jgi:SGT1 protein
VTDGDGEFLLAEAAHVLPKWLNPDVAENRVCFSGAEQIREANEESRSGSVEEN